MDKRLVKTAALTLTSVLVINSINLTNFEASAATKKQKVTAVKKAETKLLKNKLVNKKTGKVIKNLVSYNGKIYKNGVLFAGNLNGLVYVKGKKANKVISGILYANGKKANKVISGILYVNGKKANDVVGNLFYKAGKKASGIAKNGRLYIASKESTGEYYYNGKWYNDAIIDIVKNKKVEEVVKAINSLNYESTLEEIIAVEKLLNDLPEAVKNKMDADLLQGLTDQKEYVEAEENLPDEFLEYAKENLLLKSTPTANYYYANEINESLINEYRTYFEETMTPYFEKLFPRLQGSIKQPRFVFLGNDTEKSTLDFTNKFYGSVSLPYGWYSPSKDITVMMHISQSFPYESINTVLLPHEYFHWVNDTIYSGGIPSWLNEGIAYNISWALVKNTTNFMENSLYGRYTDEFIKNESLTINDSGAYMVVTAYIQGIYGQEKLEQLLIRSKEEGFKKVFKAIYGKDVDAMMAETREYIKANQ